MAKKKTVRKTKKVTASPQGSAKAPGKKISKTQMVAHGGKANVGVRKAARPLDLKKPIRVTLKSKWAKGKLALNTTANKKAIDEIIRERADQFGISIQAIENSGDSVKITLITKAREPFQDYLRTMSALIARKVTGARRGKPFGKRFWDHLALTESVTD